MFSLLPFTLSCQLGVLPVEMWSAILRFLDPMSLLAGARSHKLWLNVCRGDPVLRQRLHGALKEEKHRFDNMFVNPRLLISVFRQSAPKEYGVNIKKSVIRNNQGLPPIFDRNPQYFTQNTNFRKQTNKMKSKKRFSPYRV